MEKNDLAYFLIDNERNIDKGIELFESALKIDPDNYLFFEKSDSLTPIFKYDSKYPLQELKRAIVKQGNK